MSPCNIANLQVGVERTWLRKLNVIDAMAHGYGNCDPKNRCCENILPR